MFKGSRLSDFVCLTLCCWTALACVCWMLLKREGLMIWSQNIHRVTRTIPGSKVPTHQLQPPWSQLSTQWLVNDIQGPFAQGLLQSSLVYLVFCTLSIGPERADLSFVQNHHAPRRPTKYDHRRPSNVLASALWWLFSSYTGQNLHSLFVSSQTHVSWKILFHAAKRQNVHVSKHGGYFIWLWLV